MVDTPEEATGLPRHGGAARGDEEVANPRDLTEAERDGVMAEDLEEEEDEEGKKAAPRWAAIGKLLAPEPASPEALVRSLKAAWGLLSGVKWKELGANLVLFEFLSAGDWERVMSNGPWCFNNDAVVLIEYDGATRPSQLSFHSLPIWIRIYDLPLKLMTRRGGRLMGEKVGRVLDVETDGEGLGWGEYLRVRVELDIRKPLPRGVLVQSKSKTEGEWFKIKYEKLPSFCFACGIIGHVERDCGREEEERKPKYGGWMRSPPDRYPRPTGNGDAGNFTREDSLNSYSKGIKSDNSSWDNRRATASGSNDSYSCPECGSSKQMRGDETEVTSPVKRRRRIVDAIKKIQPQALVTTATLFEGAPEMEMEHASDTPAVHMPQASGEEISPAADRSSPHGAGQVATNKSGSRHGASKAPDGLANNNHMGLVLHSKATSRERNNIDPGLVFLPSPKILVGYYLRNFAAGLHVGPGTGRGFVWECDEVFSTRPEVLTGLYPAANPDGCWFFLTRRKPRVRAVPNGGSWRVYRAKRAVVGSDGEKLAGAYHQNLEYMMGEKKNVVRTGWLMEEFGLDGACGSDGLEPVLCTLHRSARMINKQPPAISSPTRTRKKARFEGTPPSGTELTMLPSSSSTDTAGLEDGRGLDFRLGL